MPNMDKVKMHADNVPRGILFLGDINSPDILAPDIIPVTPENKTPNTISKKVYKSFKGLSYNR